MNTNPETMLDLVEQLHQAIASDDWPAALELVAQLHILAKHIGANHEHTRPLATGKNWND